MSIKLSRQKGTEAQKTLLCRLCPFMADLTNLDAISGLKFRIRYSS